MPNLNKIPSNKGNGFQQPDLEDGSYPARVVQVIDLGLQAQRPWKGQEKPPKHEVFITYELLDEFCVDEEGNELTDKPRWVSERIPLNNLDNDKAKSTQRYNVLDPNNEFGGEFLDVVGQPCVVTLVINKKDDKTYTNVASISAMRAKDASKAPELQGTPTVFNLESPNKEVFDAFPEWIQDVLKGNLEYAGSRLAEMLGDDSEPEAKGDEDDSSEPSEGKDW